MYRVVLYHMTETTPTAEKNKPNNKFIYYRPQTKFVKLMFLHVSVCPWGVSRPRPRGEVEESGRGVSRPRPREEVGGSGQGGV